MTDSGFPIDCFEKKNLKDTQVSFLFRTSVTRVRKCNDFDQNQRPNPGLMKAQF